MLSIVLAITICVTTHGYTIAHEQDFFKSLLRFITNEIYSRKNVKNVTEAILESNFKFDDNHQKNYEIW